MDLSPVSTSNKFRRMRMQEFWNLVETYLSKGRICRILDLGGTIEFWRTWSSVFDLRQTEIVCINTFDQPADLVLPNVTCIKGDACNLSQFADSAFDVVFSNSCIEHVGAWPQMSRFASEVRRVGTSYFIQTPNFWFPIEAHARMPFIHWLPDQITYRLHMMTKAGFYPKADDVQSAMEIVEDARLLDIRQMRTLFPDAEIQKEKFFGLTKALVAVRQKKPVAGQQGESWSRAVANEPGREKQAAS